MKKIMLCVFAFIMLFLTVQAVFAGELIDTPSGSCCPSLYVYDGSDYQFSQVLVLESDESVQSYRLNVTPIAIDGAYRMYLTETKFTSYIDQVKLIVNGIALPICHGDNLLKHSDDNFLTLDSSSIAYIAFPSVPSNAFEIQIEGYVGRP